MANTRNGIDVDRWDYMQRDAYHTNAAKSFDCWGIQEAARVIPVKGQMQICYRDTVLC